jgi:hypothetical protein
MSKRIGNECLAVEIRPVQRPKHVARPDFPAVAFDPSQGRRRPIAAHIAATQPATNRIAQFSDS